MTTKVIPMGTRYGASEWSGEEDTIHDFKIDGEDVSVGIVNPERAKREKISPFYVIWGGAVDWEGKKREFKKRYPELKKVI